MTRVLGRYVFKEIATPFVLGTFILSFVALMPQVLRLAEQVLAFGVDLYGFLLLISYLLPPVLLFVVPAAFLLAVLVAFGRLSADSEIIAIRAGGVSLWQLLPPVLLLGVLASVVTAGMSAFGEPWGRSSVTSFIYKLGETKAAGLVRERTFNDDFFGLVVYADAVSPKESRLSNVFLADQRDPKQRFAVHAREGLVIADPETRSIVLRLVDGTVDHLGVAGAPVTRVTFERMDYNVLPDTTKQAGRDPYEMYPMELYSYLVAKGEKAKGREWMAFHKKFAYPVSALLMGILGIALGISDPRHGKGRGYLYGLAAMILYYLLVRFGDSFGEQKVIPPLAAAWLPNVVFFALGMWLFTAQAREEPTFVEKLTARLSR